MYHRDNRHPFKMRTVDVHLDLSVGAHLATLTKAYKVIPTFAGLTQLVHRNINADGEVCDFYWDGAPIAQSNIRLTSGDYEVTIPFTPPPRRGSEFPGELKYTLKNSFASNREWLTYAVDFPSDVLSAKDHTAKCQTVPKSGRACRDRRSPGGVRRGTGIAQPPDHHSAC